MLVVTQCPESFEGLGPSGARASVGSAFTTGLLVDIGLETSIPDTFSAPAPLPYDLLLGRPQCADSDSIKGRISERREDLGGSDCKTQASSVILSPRKSDFSKQKGWKQSVDEEEESCPICFEGKKSISFSLQQAKSWTHVLPLCRL